MRIDSLSAKSRSRACLCRAPIQPAGIYQFADRFGESDAQMKGFHQTPSFATLQFFPPSIQVISCVGIWYRCAAGLPPGSYQQSWQAGDWQTTKHMAFGLCRIKSTVCLVCKKTGLLCNTFFPFWYDPYMCAFSSYLDYILVM